MKIKLKSITSAEVQFEINGGLFVANINDLSSDKPIATLQGGTNSGLYGGGSYRLNSAARYKLLELIADKKKPYSATTGENLKKS